MVRPEEFDKSDEESVFLSFVAKEFSQRGSELRSTLSNKSQAPDIVSKLGLRCARRFNKLSSLEDLSHEVLGKRVALKYGRGWSAKGVMLLEQLDDTRYFDHHGLKTLTLDDVIKGQQLVARYYKHLNPYWLLEEFLCGLPSAAEIPFDYKFYTFQGIVAFVISIDRNTTPAKIAIFDGNLNPLEVDADYLMESPKVQQGPHLLPLNIAEHLYWAKTLSLMTDAPFVRIDMYETDQGASFGEFTFSPGDVHKRMFKLDRLLLDRCDRLFSGAEWRLKKNKPTEWRSKWLKNYPLQSALWDFDLAELSELQHIDKYVYRRYADIILNDGHAGYSHMAKAWFRLKNESDSSRHRKVYDCTRACWRGIENAYVQPKSDE